MGRGAAGRGIRVRAAVVWARGAVAKVRAVACPRHAGAAVRDPVLHVAAGAPSDGRRAASALGAHDRVVQHRAGAALPVVHQALADLPDGTLDALGGALDLDYPLSRLGQHLLLGDHAHARHILNVLDLEALAADDGAHLVVRDKELDCCARGQG